MRNLKLGVLTTQEQITKYNLDNTYRLCVWVPFHSTDICDSVLRIS
jgi:hypothetical protein